MIENKYIMISAESYLKNRDATRHIQILLNMALYGRKKEGDKDKKKKEARES